MPVVSAAVLKSLEEFKGTGYRVQGTGGGEERRVQGEGEECGEEYALQDAACSVQGGY